MLQLKIMTKIILFFGSILLNTLLFSQDESTIIEKLVAEYGLKQSQQGYYYKIDQEGNGYYPKKGDYIMMNYIAKLPNGTVYDRSEINDPFIFQQGYRQVVDGWDAGIIQFKAGSKGKLLIPSKFAYGSVGVGTKIPPNTPIFLDIELIKFMTPTEYDNYMMEKERAEQLAFEDKMKKQKEADKMLIKSYVQLKKINASQTKSGVYYEIEKKGKGDNIKIGDKVEIVYYGYLLNEKLFDFGSEKGRNFKFVVGKKKVIEGLDEAILQFKPNAKGTIIIPSHLAYGPRYIQEKDIDIPANSVLVFKIKVEKVEKE